MRLFDIVFATIGVAMLGSHDTQAQTKSQYWYYCYVLRRTTHTFALAHHLGGQSPQDHNRLLLPPLHRLIRVIRVMPATT